jgi:hypothetical protein
LPLICVLLSSTNAYTIYLFIIRKIQVMLKPVTKAGGNGGLSDKDIQLLKKTYRKLTELYYENTKN